jgi:hypothetical protein
MDGISMEQRPKNFEEQLQYGRGAEMAVAEYLKSRGFCIIPSYDYSGKGDDKAPKLTGVIGAFPVPDLDVAKDGGRRWIEVKRKAGATFHRNSGAWEHGIPLRLFNAYKKVEEITGNEVWLFVVEDETSDVLCGKLSILAQSGRCYTGYKMSWGGMIFFPRKKFIKLTTLNLDATEQHS